MAEKETKELDPIEQLLDENNTDNIVMYNEDGNPQEFEQIAIVPVKDNIYAVLHPVAEDVDEDEVWVFAITEINGDGYLVFEEDEKVVQEVFDNLKKLLDEETKK